MKKYLIGIVFMLFSIAFMRTSHLSAGPVVLMGIDAEDGGVGGHGPISVYESVINDILSNVTNGGTGILVIGGGKNASDDVTEFWNQISTDTGVSITFANGAANITAQSFGGFAMIAVVSDQFNTFSGGLTQAENDALAGRAADVAMFVNDGGGLLGFSQNFTNSYAYVGGLGTFTFNTGLGYADITPTAAGLAIGITDVMDICCWHDEYLTFPGFLKILATNASTGNAATIGGSQVIIVFGITLIPSNATLPVGQDHTVTAAIADQNGNPLTGRNVDFEVVSGPHAGLHGSAVTDSNGHATFTYTGTLTGTDVIEARFVDDDGITKISNQVTVTWEKATAIELVYFTAKTNANDSVTLTWKTATEIDNAGFNLYRAKDGGSFTKINDTLISAKGSSVSGAKYKFVDNPGPGKYYYNLEDIDTDGKSTMHNAVSSKKVKRSKK